MTSVICLQHQSYFHLFTRKQRCATGTNKTSIRCKRNLGVSLSSLRFSPVDTLVLRVLKWGERAVQARRGTFKDEKHNWYLVRNVVSLMMMMTFDFSGMRTCTQGSAALEMDCMSAVAAAPGANPVTDGRRRTRPWHALWSDAATWWYK